MSDMIEIQIASVTDREELVAEIWVGSQMLAELRHEGGEHRVQLYPRTDGEPWDLLHADIVRTLEEARTRLLHGRQPE